MQGRLVNDFQRNNWMELISLLIEIYAAGCVLFLILLLGINRWLSRTMLNSEIVLVAILWPVILLASLLWLGAYWIVGYFNRKNRTQDEL